MNRMTVEQMLDRYKEVYVIQEGTLSRGDTVMGYVSLYHGPNGAKCPLGHLIPEDSFNVLHEGRPPLVVFCSYPHLQGLPWSFVDKLLRVHDSYVPYRGSGDEIFAQRVKQEVLDLLSLFGGLHEQHDYSQSPGSTGEDT